MPDPDALKARKAAARRRGADGIDGAFGPSPAAPEASSVAPSTSVVGGLVQRGLAAVDNSAANQGSPPDTTGAIGPSHYLEFVNSKVAVYRRTDLGSVAQRDLDAFVGRSGHDVFDPQIQWDQQASRWFYVADDIDFTGKNFLAFGWSKTADPTDLVDGWCRFVASTDIGGKFIDDFPKLGHDDTRVVFGTNVFRNFFQTAHVWVFPKPANGATACSAPTLSVFGSPSSPLRTSDGDPAFTPVPANTTDNSSSAFVVAADWPLFVSDPSQIMAWHVGGSAASPTLVEDGNMNVGSFDIPANVPQPGTSNVLDSSDTRLTQAVARADPDAGGAEAIWTQHTVAGSGGRSVVRWYELLPGSVSVRQQGTLEDPNHSAFNAAIAPAGNGSSAAIFYNVGSGSLLAQVRAQSRQGGTALGEMGGEIVLGSSAAADQDFTCTAPSGPPCRWGDYSGATTDPSSADVVWGSNQINDPFTSDPHWATLNFAVSTSSPAGYPRPLGATPIRVGLVPAFTGCSAPSSSHGPPLASPSCNPPVQASDQLTVGTLDANGAPANSAGVLRMSVVTGDPGTPQNEGDVALSLTLRDVRRKSDLSDYPGELQAAATLRITDKLNGPAQDEAGTVTDVPLTFTAPCVVTTDTSVGSTCSISTTANALTPDLVRETERTIWQLDQLQVFDGGADGDADTLPNSVFARQGVFVP